MYSAPNAASPGLSRARIGLSAAAIALDRSGNIYVAGESYAPSPGHDLDIMTIKYDRDKN